MVNKLRIWWDNLPWRSPHDRVRRNLTALGCPWAVDMTDEEIEAGAQMLGRVARDAGVSIEEADRAFRALGRGATDG